MKHRQLNDIEVAELPILDFEAGTAGKTIGNAVVLDVFWDIFIGFVPPTPS